MKPILPTHTLRPLTPADQGLIRELMFYAIFVPPGTPLPDRALLDEPRIAAYYQDWGRAGDFGFAGLAGDDSAQPVGAVWLRLFPAEAPGYGTVSPAVPELSIALTPPHRGQGLGSRLLTAALDEAARRGFESVSLSVSPTNPALRLYIRAGFEPVHSEDDSMVMLRRLLPPTRA